MDLKLIILHCYIKDYLHANNLKPHEAKITDPLILSVKSAKKKHEPHLEV